MRNPNWAWVDTRTDLPKWLFQAIGAITVEWSSLEDEMQECIRRYADVPIRMGRILTEGMSAHSRQTIIRNLVQASVYDRKIPAALLNEWRPLQKRLKNLEERRNNCVHGIWGQHEGKWYLLRTNGTREVLETKPEISTLSRAVLPHRELATVASMTAIRGEIEKAKSDVIAWRKRVDAALPASTHESTEQLSDKYRRASRSRAKLGS